MINLRRFSDTVCFKRSKFRIMEVSVVKKKMFLDTHGGYFALKSSKELLLLFTYLNTQLFR